MSRQFYPFWRLLLYPTRLHIICAAVALLCCVPVIFPEICPQHLREHAIRYAGGTLLAVLGISATFVILTVIIHIFRLSNTRAFSQFLKCLSIWSFFLLCYILLALAADVSPPASKEDSFPIQTTDTLHPAHDQLNGPASLIIHIDSSRQQAEQLVKTPNLTILETQHESLFKSYLEQSPRWSGHDGDDTFYSKPGHLVMVPPTTSGAPGLVHVCFRSLVEGDPLPAGYTIMQPGAPFPPESETNGRIPDIALDLGRNHYLLLAWRGSTHRETAFKAINAAIAATDARMQMLAESPTRETVQRLLRGRESYTGTTPELRLSEPLAQEGAYQAEIYANPGEQGVILLYIKDIETEQTIKILNCPARHSDNVTELFRHDIPGSIPQWIRSTAGDDTAKLFPSSTPLFVIRTGKQHQYFGVAFEVWFKPTDANKNSRLLLRRCYKVQAYDPPAIETTGTDTP